MSAAPRPRQAAPLRGIRVLPDLGVWAALMALLTVSLVCAYLPLGWLNTPIGLAIAGIKAGLVGGMFMGLGRARPLLRLAAAAGFFWVTVLFGLTLSDLLTRGWPT